jgi:hypothetical protein
MRTSTNILTKRISVLAAMLVALLFRSGDATAQIFVTNVYGTPQTLDGSVGEYNLDGTTVNSALIPSGLKGPIDIVATNNNLFVLNSGGEFIGSVNRYTISGAPVNVPLISRALPRAGTIFGENLYITNAGSVSLYSTTGTAVNTSLVSGLASPYGIAISGDGARLFVSDFDDNIVGEYDAATGMTINAALITGLSNPTGITISGTSLYVANSGTGIVGKYNLDGTPVNTSLVTGLSNPLDVAVLGGDLFAVNNGNNSVGEYDAATGSAINPSLITGLVNPQGIAVVPEPSTFALSLFGAICIPTFVRAYAYISRLRRCAAASWLR